MGVHLRVRGGGWEAWISVSSFYDRIRGSGLVDSCCTLGMGEYYTQFCLVLSFVTPLFVMRHLFILASSYQPGGVVNGWSLMCTLKLKRRGRALIPSWIKHTFVVGLGKIVSIKERSTRNALRNASRE